MKKRKRFNLVKHLKSLSRRVLQTPQGRPISPKKAKLLQKITRREMHDFEEEV
jgi:hypothetical protein